MKITENEKLVAEILTNCQYLTLATSRADVPWSSSVFYAWDSSLALLFMSACDSQHVIEISANPRVAFSIFDSHQAPGTGNGIQGVGRARRAIGGELSQLLTLYYSRRFPSDNDFLPRLAGLVDRVTKLSAAFGKGLYVIEPSELWCLDPSILDIDRRVAVDRGRIAAMLPRLWPRDRD